MRDKQISGAVARQYHIQTVEKMQAEIEALRARAEKAEAEAKQLRAFLDEVEQRLADSERALDVLTWMRVRRETDEALAGKGE